MIMPCFRPKFANHFQGIIPNFLIESSTNNIIDLHNQEVSSKLQILKVDPKKSVPVIIAKSKTRLFSLKNFLLEMTSKFLSF